MTVLSVRDLSVSALNVPLVRNVSFDIAKGEMLALVGESGSGKTLTALSIMGLLPDGLRQSGEIKVIGDRLQVTGKKAETCNLKPATFLRGRDAGMIFQEPMTSLNPLHTVEKQIAEAIRIHQRGMREAEIRARVIDLLTKVGLGHFKDRLKSYPHQLSGGERQRVMIAMAIANAPMLLIADEPTTALDVTIQAQILSLIADLRARLNMAVLLITHDLTLVRRIADRVAIMSKGELVEIGKVSEIFESPKHPYTKHLLACEPGNAPAPETRKGKTLIECTGLSVAFPRDNKFLSWKKSEQIVLSDVNLEVAEGTTLGVVGESGSGKTSLAFALLRLIKSSGSIRLGGVAIDALKGKYLRQKRRDMQIVFQDPYSSLNPRMTVGRIVAEGLYVQSSFAGHEAPQLRRQIPKLVDSILAEVGLEADVKERYPHEFSGGQRQRVSIARALILKPKLLILDEPTSALDMSVQAQILELLKGLQQKHRLTYIFISHDLRVVRAISHRILVLQKGRVVESGEARDIFAHPKEEYTRALLKAALL